MRGFFKKSNKLFLAAAILILCLGAAGGGVYAWLLSRSETVTNTFYPVQVTCAVEETFLDGVKSHVTVRNTGDIPAWIRAEVVATFVNSEGKVLATAPVEGTDYVVHWGSAGWAKGADGFWYHAEPVNPGNLTAELIQTAKSVSSPSGYRLQLQIIATALQAQPDAAVQQAWGVTPADGKLVP